MQAILDLRSDTVTQPTDEMREVMMRAEVGDDVFSDDPSINSLEKFAAEYFEKEAALFVVSGTQSNLCALLAHCQRGDEYIVGQNAHTYKYEGGGAAVLGSIQPQPLEHLPDSTIDISKIKAAIKPDDSHFARTRLICLENTIGGKIISQEYINQVYEIAKEAGLGFHLDGARLLNAAVGQSLSASQIAKPFDSVSICLSKGLGAPVGSVLLGDKSFIKSARRWRKVLGGGTRQAGFLAAAGEYALKNNVERLAEDHKNAEELAKLLTAIGLDVSGHETNMVFVNITDAMVVSLGRFMEDRGVLLHVRGKGLRIVLHLGIRRDDVDYIVSCFTDYIRQSDE